MEEKIAPFYKSTKENNIWTPLDLILKFANL